ncbi:TetR/AcrR family transcriptional regulator [Marinicrinis sediminis]|uniref:TetR/AcrR family transcriptional regulator n=1 Tax=Marinicrinis sediminis TaxID=1652465 RepID=A0ABW5RAQ5_9BACL
MARKAVEQELNREIIVEVARELFATKGYQSVSMRAIAKKLGYSHGSLYYHFQDKAELFYNLVVDDFTHLFNRQMKILNDGKHSAMERLKIMMEEFIQFGLQNKFQYEIMFLIQDNDLRRYSRTEQAKCFDLFSRAVNAALEETASIEISLFSLPWSLFMSLHGFVTYCNRFDQTYDEVQKLANDHITFLCNNLLKNLADIETVQR